jgi:NADH-quinone oxidoreductase subunit N
MNLSLSLISPEITLFLGALTILMLDVFLAKKFKDFFYVSHILALAACIAALFLIIQNFVVAELGFNNMFLSNSLTSFAKSITILLLSIVVLFSLKFVTSFPKISAEFLALLMIATTGGMVLISANDFITFYLGLELQALSLYLLAALNRKSAKSSEAGMKYFILGCLSSGILLFGISLVYGFSGTTNFSTLVDLYYTSHAKPEIPFAVMFGFILVVTAMFFKISAAPFHMWSPDVYEGSATISTTFFATVAKFTAVIALIKLFSSLMIHWQGVDKILILVAILSLAVGSFGAIFQKNLKRLLAYSSIGHVGFILLGIMIPGEKGVSSSLLYILIYAIISIGSFGFLNLITSATTDKESDEENDKIFNISALSGLAKTNPVMAFSLAVLMFSTAGIPPLAGFFSKFFILTALLSHGYLITAIVAVLFSVISAYYYLRIVKIMYFDEPTKVIELEQVSNIKVIIFATAIFNILFIFFLDSFVSLISNFSGF